LLELSSLDSRRLDSPDSDRPRPLLERLASTALALAIADSADDSRLDSVRRNAEVASDSAEDLEEEEELPLIRWERDWDISEVLELSLLLMI